MGKVVPIRPDKLKEIQEFEAGYSDGYNRRSFHRTKNNSLKYNTGYSVGICDRAEDEEITDAILSGDTEPLTEEERKAIYGDESDRC